MKTKVTKNLPLHQRLRHHAIKHFHRHAHKILHITHFLNHHIFHSLELIIVVIITLSSFGFSDLTGLNQEVYRNNSSEVAEALLDAMKNPSLSLKKGNIISVWTMDLDIENTFAKGYCTYGAARISPEFFPYIDSTTQQRTWGGNAVDRCKNAAETGYKIGLSPAQGALIVYEAGGKFGAYGHVGKVLHYDRSRNKIIVRDMAWVARGSMSDRREDLSTAQVECYIYNSKTAIPETTIDQTDTGAVTSTGTLPDTETSLQPNPPVSPGSSVSPTQEVPSTTPVHTAPTEPIAQQTGTQIQEPTPEPVQQPTPTTQQLVTKEVNLSLDNLSDISQHFVNLHDITIKVSSKSPLLLGETAGFTVLIKDKVTGEPYSGLIPFSFTLLSTNDSIQPDISTIKMINNGILHIQVVGQKIGTATVVFFIDNTRIGGFTVETK